MLRGMHTTQIAVRIPDDLLADIDDRIPGQFASRADAVRSALVALMEKESLADREARHRQGWIDHPPSSREERSIKRDAQSLIAEEPW